jgi:O-antigen/teichoic acid export membrane protein
MQRQRGERNHVMGEMPVQMVGRTPRLKRNLIANFIGAGWLAVSGLIFAPIYIRVLGVEAYGLISFYYLLQGALQIFDFGLSPTMNREMARYSVQPERADEARDFARTFEVGYWSMGLALGALVWVAAPFLAMRWLKVDTLTVDVVQFSIISMAVLLALQWPLTLYEGGLLGLQRQVLLNGLLVFVATLRTVGAVAFMLLTSPTVVNFFLWQIGVGVVHVVLLTGLFWRSLPVSSRAPRVNLQLTRRVWHFAAGMTGTALLWFILSQADKFMLSKTVSLEVFGLYALASAIANSLSILIGGPVFNATFPRFSTLVALADKGQVRSFYHFSSQLIAVFVFPLAAILAGFSYEIVLLWLGDPGIARIVAPIAAVLVIGTGLSVLKSVPYALQLAYGWSSIGFRINVFSIIGYLPVILVTITRFGAIGAAISWGALCAAQVVAVLLTTHHRGLKGDVKCWIWIDNVPPFLGSIGVVLLGKYIVSGITSSLAMVMVLLTLFVAALGVSILSASQVRSWIWGQFAGRRHAIIL